MIETYFCDYMYNFVKEHISELKQPIKMLGFKSEEDMLSQIKSDVGIAGWAMHELCTWGLKENYKRKLFQCKKHYKDGSLVFKIGNRYIMTQYSETDYCSIVEVSKIKRRITIKDWALTNK